MENPQPTTTQVSLGDWMLTLFLMAIPLVNLIMLFVWAFGSGTPPSKVTFAKAALIWMAITIVISLLFTVMGITLLRSIF